jgi:hypothetical protein
LGNLQLKGKDKAEFWAFSVAFGYQNVSTEDGDPDQETPTGGETPKSYFGSIPYGYSVVYMEANRERQFSDEPPWVFSSSSERPRLVDAYLDDVYSVIAHEIGHAPGRHGGGTDHSEGGIMKKEAIDIKLLEFTPPTLRRFRSAISWTQ